MIKKLLSFIMLFVVTFCFVSGCKDDEKEQAVLVVDGKEVIATINRVNYTADQVYGDLINLNSNAEYLYNELEDLLIKTMIPVTESMRNRIVNEVEVWKKGIKENATISGKSYKEALATALQEEGVASEEELIEKKLFALQEEIITNQYWSNNEEKYYNDYLNNSYIYHISQILVTVSTSSGESQFFDSRPTSDNAKKLYDVIDALLNGESFYNVALRYSDDSTSKDKGGDLGIVTLNDTALSNEVKYALANYSIYFENADMENPDNFDGIFEDGFEAIPQKYVDKLGELYEKSDTYYTKNSDTDSLTTRVYARNIIFNNLFNTRSFRFLQSDENKNVKLMDEIKMPLTEEVGFGDATSQNILVNSDGNPILVVRSDSAIHFISIQKSAFAGEDELKKYYSKEVDYTDNYKTYLEKAIDENDKTARLDKLESFAKEYATMKISGNSQFAGNEDFIRYDMFNYYLNGSSNNGKFEIKNETVKNIVIQYINSKKDYMKKKITNVFNEGFEKVANLVEYSNMKIVEKEIPILKCLEKNSNDKYMCTYTYKEGFKLYGSSGGGQ